jgi:CRISPR-associated endonuclease Csn1
MRIDINAIGFAGVVREKRKILFCGAHTFDAAENPKDGSAPAIVRREKRMARRVIDRKGARKRAIRRLLARHGLKEVAAIDARGAAGCCVWGLRRKALEEVLSDAELCRVLFHMAKRRGFQSGARRVAEEDTDGKRALEGARQLRETMLKAGAPTIGAYLATLPKKRNADGRYDRSVMRDLVREEAARIFAVQRKLGNGKASARFEKEYAELAFVQRPRQSSEDRVGFCAFERGERRAPKFAYTAELFVLWSRLNNLHVREMTGEERRLTKEEKTRLAELAHERKGGVTYKQARKALGVDDDVLFNIAYRKPKADEAWEDIREAAEKALFVKLPGYHALKAVLETERLADWRRWTEKDRDKLDEISRILSFCEDPGEIESRLGKLGVADPKRRAALAGITEFSRTVSLSLKALRRIVPGLMEGMSYEKACKTAGYDPRRRESGELEQLPPFEGVYDAVVNRALAQARKVLNAVLRTRGMPERVLLEVAEEVGRDFSDRKERERRRERSAALGEKMRKELEADILAGRTASSGDLIKFRLWQEQRGFCVYSGEYIPPEVLRDPHATRIDHILPFARSWDDSYLNKVLCLTDEALRKGRRTPVEYLGATDRWEGLRAMAVQLPRRKAERCLMASFDAEKAAAWKMRQLTDSRHVARLVKDHLERYLALGADAVETRNGAMMARLRGAWGFPDKERRNDRYLAAAALVLASATEEPVERLASWNAYEARAKAAPGEKPLPPAPWKRFREDARAAADRVFVSRLPVRKVTGAAHEETVRSLRPGGAEGPRIVQRVRLKDLTPAVLERLVDLDRNRKLYEVLKARLRAHDGKPELAFAEPVYMPVTDPTRQGPVINGVRVVTNERSGVRVRGGIARNGDMVRVDVFHKDGKFLLVPVYAHHFAGAGLPNRAIAAHKPEHEWDEVDESAFVFSLYRNDLIRVETKTEEIVGYYVGTHRGTGGINVRAHDRDPSFGKNGDRLGVGTRTLVAFEKYAVDYFGNRTRILKETRLGVARDPEPERGGTRA